MKIDLPIVVEGKYDKIKLTSFIDATVIPTDGFGIFKNKEKVELLRKLSHNNGVIVLTDSDSAGSIIRSYLKNVLGDEKIYNVFLPEIKGKEKRKSKNSAEGLLGVEGIDEKTITDALKKYLPAQIVNSEKKTEKTDPITKAFLMQCGLSGCENSSKLRIKLLNKMGIPSSIAPNTLIRVLNDISNKDEIIKIIEEIKRSDE